MSSPITRTVRPSTEHEPLYWPNNPPRDWRRALNDATFWPFSYRVPLTVVLLLWPVTIPLGFGEVWWASRQAHPPGKRDEAPKAAPASKPALAKPESSHAAPSVPQEPEPIAKNGETAIPKPQVAALDSADKTGALAMPGPFERHRLLARELVPGALDGAAGVIAAAGGRVTKPRRRAA